MKSVSTCTHDNILPVCLQNERISVSGRENSMFKAVSHYPLKC